MLGEKPADAFSYVREGSYEWIAWSPPAEPGDALCLGLTGRSERQLVHDILNGAYSHLFTPEEGDVCFPSTEEAQPCK